MKTTNIVALVAIAVAMAVIIITTGESSTYATFAEAKEMAQAGNDQVIHVVGELKKSAQGDVLGIQSSPTGLEFSFVLVDADSVEERVYFNKPMPADFLSSEQVVVLGHYNQDRFVSSEVLMKCPSKYEDDELTVSSL